MGQFWAGWYRSSSGSRLSVCSHDNVRGSTLVPLLLAHSCQHRHSHGLSCCPWAQAVLPHRGAGCQRAVLDHGGRGTRGLWGVFHALFCSYKERRRQKYRLTPKHTKHLFFFNEVYTSLTEKLEISLLFSSCSTVSQFIVNNYEWLHLSRQSFSVRWSLDSPCGPAATASNEPPHSVKEILHSERITKLRLSYHRYAVNPKEKSLYNWTREMFQTSFFFPNLS